MKSIYKKTILTVAIAATAFLSAGQVFAQADSTTGNGALNWRALVPLYAQERETPVIQQFFPVTRVAPSTYPSYGGVAGGGGGTWLTTSTSSCGSDTLVSGGGQCWTPGNSFGRVQQSYPSGSSWVLVCGADENGSDGSIYGQAYALCTN